MKRFAPVAFVGGLALLAACTAKQQQPATKSSRAVLDAYVDAWNHHDSLAVDSILTKDGYHEDVAFGIKARNPDGVNAFMRDLIKEEPDFVWKVTSVVEGDNALAMEWTWTSTYTGDSPSGPVTALKISGRGASVAELENGKIKRFTDYYDEASFFPKKTDQTKEN